LLPLQTRAGPTSFEWGDTTVALPPGTYLDAFTEASRTIAEGEGVRADALFAQFPVALLVGSP